MNMDELVLLFKKFESQST